VITPPWIVFACARVARVLHRQCVAILCRFIIHTRSSHSNTTTTTTIIRKNVLRRDNLFHLSCRRSRIRHCPITTPPPSPLFQIIIVIQPTADTSSRNSSRNNTRLGMDEIASGRGRESGSEITRAHQDGRPMALRPLRPPQRLGTCTNHACSISTAAALWRNRNRNSDCQCRCWARTLRSGGTPRLVHPHQSPRMPRRRDENESERTRTDSHPFQCRVDRSFPPRTIRIRP
jgi:hypothetical protein